MDRNHLLVCINWWFIDRSMSVEESKNTYLNKNKMQKYQNTQIYVHFVRMTWRQLSLGLSWGHLMRLFQTTPFITCISSSKQRNFQRKTDHNYVLLVFKHDVIWMIYPSLIPSNFQQWNWSIFKRNCGIFCCSMAYDQLCVRC